MREKIKCPFTFNGVKQTTDDWMLIVKCGKNNHNDTQYPEISKGNIKLKELLNSLKQKDELNYNTLRTIYNTKYNIKEYDGWSQMQKLMHKLMKLNYIQWHRMDEHNDCIPYLMFAYPTSIDCI